MSKLTPPVSSKDHMEGLADAPIELVEYGDFECPHCGAAYPIIKEVQKHFGKELKFVFRYFPLSNIHPHAIAAAMAAEAAGRQNKFWEMHDMIFENQSILNERNLVEFAKKLGLDLGAFKTNLQDPAIAELVDDSFESGVRSGVNGTPSFFINGRKYNGSYDAGSISDSIRKTMTEKHSH